MKRNDGGDATRSSGNPNNPTRSSRMTPRRMTPRMGRWLAWLLVALLVVAMVAVQNHPGGTDPLDPTSTAADGTKAMVELLDHFGVHTSVSSRLSSPQSTMVFVLADTFSPSQRDDLQAWVRDGGTLVVADPSSPLNFLPGTGNSLSGYPLQLRPDCAAPFAEGITQIEPESSGDYATFRPADGDTACFSTDNRAFVVQRNVGSGTIVQVGGPSIFTNAQLGKVDNSVLVMNLFGSSSNKSLTIVTPSEVGGGNQTIGDLVPTRVKNALWQLVIAVIVFALACGRRLGHPVEEPQPVEIPASQLVVAVGELFQLSNRSDEAARLLRVDARRRMAKLLSLPPQTDVTVLADAVSIRTGVNRDRLLNALAKRPVLSGNDLLHAAQDIENVYREVADVK